MGCRNDYMEPTAAEKTSKNIAELIRYVLIGQQKPVPHMVDNAATNPYGDSQRLNHLTKWLCTLCTEMSAVEQNKFIYNGRVEMARKLATWWEQHQKDDERHAEEDAEAERIEALKDSAKRKLTREEIDALLGE